MRILEACPGNAVTGGPEAIHQFISNLNKIDGIDAAVWYWNSNSSDPCPPEYKKYNCDYITELPPDYDGVLILPEIWAKHIHDYPARIRAIHWLGLDAYAMWTPVERRGDFLEDDEIFHLVQSEYARDLMSRLGVKHLYKIDDSLNDDFYAEYDEAPRSDTILYNPAKMTQFMEALMRSCQEFSWRPIAGMTRAQVIEAMRSSKLYVDFGEFPGRERIPREAVLCGCCIITSKIGSAAYDGDFAHRYKFESKPGHIWAIKRMIRYVLDNYDECRKDFDLFRIKLNEDKKKLIEQTMEIGRAFHEVFDSYSGA